MTVSGNTLTCASAVVVNKADRIITKLLVFAMACLRAGDVRRHARAPDLNSGHEPGNVSDQARRPPQRLTSVVTAAERPLRARSPHAGRVTDAGRSPGSRVIASIRLPELVPSGNWSGLAAYSCGSSRGFGPVKSPTAFPWSEPKDSVRTTCIASIRRTPGAGVKQRQGAV